MDSLFCMAFTYRTKKNREREIYNQPTKKNQQINQVDLQGKYFCVRKNLKCYNLLAFADGKSIGQKKRTNLARTYSNA